MRIIKFRGLNKQGKWIYGMPTYDFKYIFNSDQTDSPDNYEVNPDTVTEFTGLHDKSNKNACVYEGDIVSPQGIVIGNKYETPEILKNGINVLIEGIGTKTWTQTEKEGLARGLHYAK